AHVRLKRGEEQRIPSAIDSRTNRGGGFGKVRARSEKLDCPEHPRRPRERSGHELIENERERIQIRALVDRLAAELFRRLIRERAFRGSRRSSTDRPRDP